MLMHIKEAKVFVFFLILDNKGEKGITVHLTCYWWICKLV